MFKVLIGFLAILLPVLATPIAETVTLDCKNLDYEACKSEFALKFNEKIKSFYIPALKNVYTKYIDVYSAIVKELPAGDFRIEKLNIKIAEFRKKSQELEDGKINIPDALALSRITFGINAEDFERDSNDPYEELLKKNDFTTPAAMKFLLAECVPIIENVGKVWTSLYAGFKPSEADTETFNELNTYYLSINFAQPDYKTFLYYGWMENIVKYLNLTFIKELVTEAYAGLGQKITI